MQMDHHWSVGDGLGGSVLVPSENRGLHHGLVFFRSFGMTHSFLVCFRQAWFFFTHFGIFPPILVFCQNVWYSINVHADRCGDAESVRKKKGEKKKSNKKYSSDRESRGRHHQRLFFSQKKTFVEKKKQHNNPRRPSSCVIPSHVDAHGDGRGKEGG